MMPSLWREIRLVLRTLANSPVYAVVVVLSLALGIGGNTAIFNLMNVLVFRELPVREPEHLIELYTMAPNWGRTGLSYPLIEEIWHQQRVLDGLSAWAALIKNVEGNDTLSPAEVMWAQGNLHSVLGVQPLLGRVLEPADDGGPGKAAAQVAVISYGCWQTRFGGDPRVVGQTIRIEGVPLTIVGVTPKEFFGLQMGADTEVTIPLTVPGLSAGRDVRTDKALLLETVARVKDGVSIERARENLGALWPAVQATMVPPELNPARAKEFLSRRLQTVPAARGAGYSTLRQRYSGPLVVLMGLAGSVLLIACLNLASLMLARLLGRDRETAIRLVLGCTRWRLVRQLFTESVLLSVAGGLLGCLAGLWASRLLASFVSTGPLPLGLDLRVLGFTAVVGVSSGVLVGLASAWHVVRQDPAEVLRRTSRTTRGGRYVFGRGLVCVQVAISLILLVSAGLFVRSLQKLYSIDTGFRSEGVLTLSLIPMPGGYTDRAQPTYYRELLERISSLPGVRSASLSRLPPVLPAPYESTELVSRKSASSSTPQIAAHQRWVAPRFFETLGLGLLKGRDFAFSDDEHAPRVAILSSSLAERLFPSGDAVGQRVSVGAAAELQDVEVVGVVSDANLWYIRDQRPLMVFVASFQTPNRLLYPELEVWAVGDPAEIASEVRRETEALGQEYPWRIETLEHLVGQSLLKERLLAMLSGFSGVLALLLASIGLYGLVSYEVGRRSGEIGIRAAVGAGRGAIMFLILRQSFLLILIGLTVGLPVTLATTHLLSGMLFGLSPTDTATLVTSALILLGMGLLAALLPARRAVRVDPMVALRSE